MTPSLHAATGKDRGKTIVIDGYSSDFLPEEDVFGLSPGGQQQESSGDSKWGVNNDINQIKLTWDKDSLFVAVDGICWDNNIILLMDYMPGGLTDMTSVNAWRRNFFFSGGFKPDLFLATWDKNSTPQIWEATGPSSVTQIASTSFRSVATFFSGETGRSMEAAIPWSLLFDGSTRKLNPATGDTMYTVPSYFDSTFKFLAVLTGGADGTSGPDAAPDNLDGMTVDSSQPVTLDNFAFISLDWNKDGFVDFGVSIRDSINFKVQPPVVGIRLKAGGISLNRNAFSPAAGEMLTFSFDILPRGSSGRTTAVTAEVYDMSGKRVRQLCENSLRDAANPRNDADGIPVTTDVWDGRGEDGHFVPSGIYILRITAGAPNTPGNNRLKKAFLVLN
ncbi:MAG: hypothetical protein QME66_01095 [Candidatus Eisenbacteria bacterium]|nr:hypothetical protein [Candidatus Eisenbacteria bacterium]